MAFKGFDHSHLEIFEEAIGRIIEDKPFEDVKRTFSVKDAERMHGAITSAFQNSKIVDRDSSIVETYHTLDVVDDGDSTTIFDSAVDFVLGKPFVD